MSGSDPTSTRLRPDIHGATPTRIRVYAVVSFLLYAVAALVGDAYAASSTFREGIGHALVFGTFFLLVTFPLLVAIGTLVRWALERMVRRPLPCREVLPWFTHVPLSLALLFSTLPDSPQAIFRWYVADDVPFSLSELRCWHTRGFGDSAAILSFKLDPSEFGKVLSRYEYVEHFEPDGIRPPLLARLAKDRAHFPIALPSTPLVYEYAHVRPGLAGGFRISHYATKSQDYVITVRSSD